MSLGGSRSLVLFCSFFSQAFSDWACYKYENTFHLISRMGMESAFYGNLSCAAAKPTRLDGSLLIPRMNCARFDKMEDCLDYSRENADNWPNLICTDIGFYGSSENSENGSGENLLNLANFQILTGIGWLPAAPEDYKKLLDFVVSCNK